MSATRAKESTIQFAEAGVGLLAGSFLKCTDFKLSPDSSITDTEYVGEPEAEYDLNHKGWKLSATVHEWGPQVRAMYQRQIDANVAGNPPPRLTAMVTTRYRDGVTPPLVQRLGGLVLKLDDFDVSGGNFVKNTISGACKTAPPQDGTA